MQYNYTRQSLSMTLLEGTYLAALALIHTLDLCKQAESHLLVDLQIGHSL